MLKYVTIVCLVASLCAGASQQRGQDVQVARFDRHVQTDGYNVPYDTSDDTSREEKFKGNLKAEDPPQVKGRYAYEPTYGRYYTHRFTAGPNKGFQPRTFLGHKL